jgi:DNA-binding SARP family transcriptional activator/predicted ATPase
MQISIYFFGSPRIHQDGKPIKPDTRKALALLAYLAVTGRPQTRESLATLLYPDYDETHARGALRRTLSTLLNAMQGNYIHATRETVEIQFLDDIWVDVRQFETLFTEVREHTHSNIENCAECLAKLEQCAVLYQGDFLAGFTLRDSSAFDDWQFFQGETLRRKFASVLERLTYSFHQRNELDKAIEYARRWLALDPLLEDAHRELMRCYVLAGQRNAALRQYQECARMLKKELGVEPLEETTRLYQEIRKNKITPRLSRSNNESNLLLPVGEAKADRTSESKPQIDAHNPSALLRTYPLVGRENELSTLKLAYQQHAATGYFFALDGEPGIGKTRLADEFLSWAASRGAQVIQVRCFEGETDLTYAPFIEALRLAQLQPEALRQFESLPKEWLNEAARLSASLRAHFPGMPSLPPLSTPGAQSLFYEGLRQTLLSWLSISTPTILFFDDFHWADSASLDFFAYFVHRIKDQPIFILATWRNEKSPTVARLRQLLIEMQRRDGASGLHLNRLDAAAVAKLTRRITESKRSLPKDFEGRLYQESEGLPLILIAYLDAYFAQATDDLSNTSIEEMWRLLGNVRDLYRLRLATLDDLAAQLIAAAAVIGRSFDFETLVAISGRSEQETILGIESLLAQDVIEECGACDSPEQIRYDFTHEKLRALVYEQISLTRRRLLHRRLAEVLVEQARRAGDVKQLASQIAHHYRLCGQNSLAAAYFRQAGDYSRGFFANRQALEHYRSAQALGHPEQWWLEEACGDLHVLLGEYAQALEAYQRVRQNASLNDVPRLAYKQGNVEQRRGHWGGAIEHYQFALATEPNLQPAFAARVKADWSFTAYQSGEEKAAAELARESLASAQHAGEPRALAQANNLLGILARKRGEHLVSRRHLEESLALGRQMQDNDIQAAALNNLALLENDAGNFDAAIDYTKQALEICQRLGDRHRVAALHNNLADFYQHNEQPERAIQHLTQAVLIFTEIGGDAEKMQPEIWKLTEW